MTSSNTSTAPWRVQSSRKVAMNSAPGRTKFMFPAIGSSTTAAILSP
jgi:hypothetical protein